MSENITAEKRARIRELAENIAQHALPKSFCAMIKVTPVGACVSLDPATVLALLDEMEQRESAPLSLNEFHDANRARQHEAFAPPHPLTALVVCVQEEVGELAGAVLGVTGEKKRKAHKTREDVLDAVADAITYLSLVAYSVGESDLDGLMRRTFNMVSRRAGSAIFVAEPSKQPKAKAGE